MEGFLDHIEVILPALGFHILQPSETLDSARGAETKFELKTTFGAQATLIERAGGAKGLDGEVRGSSELERGLSRASRSPP
jgi:hypothetical protein